MKKKWVPIALAAFVVLDIILVFFAFRHTSAPASAGTPETTSSQRTEPGGGTSSEGATTGQTTTQAAQTQTVSLVSMAGSTVMRAESGVCSAEPNPVLAISTDGGASFTNAAIPQHQILRVIARSPANLQYIGANESCEASLYQSVDGGQTWSEGPADASWYLAPGEPSQNVVAPSGQVEAGCLARSISVLSPVSAFVACADGGVRGTVDGGATWSQMGEPAGIVSVSFLNPSSAYALAVAASCPAEIRRTTDGGATWNPIGCIPGGEPSSIDAVGQQVIAVVGGNVHLSSDGGVTWS